MSPSVLAPVPARRARRARSVVTTQDARPRRTRPGVGVLLAADGTRRGPDREENQDVALAHGPLLAVADGVGGHPGGARAADLAVRTLASSVGTASGDAAAALRAGVVDANARVLDEAFLRGPRGMSSTLVAAHVADGLLTVAHVGDSRGYLWRDGELLPLTTDHTLARAFAARGTSPAALAPAIGGALVRAVGLDARVEPDVRQLAVRDGDLLVLCTDGVSTPLGDAGLAAALAVGGGDPVRAAAAVLDAAAAVASDDATVLVAGLG